MPGNEPDRGAERAGGGALQREEAQHLAAREAEEAQHPELAPPRPRERGEAAGDAREADHDGDRFQRIRHREAAIEDGERAPAQLRGVLEGKPACLRQRAAHRRLSPLRVHPRREVDREIVGARVAGERPVSLRRNQDRAQVRA